jgi:acetolactate synthase I/III small subunit
MKKKEKYTDHTIAMLALNNPGVIAKISSLMARRGYNVESMTAGKTKEKGVSRLTIVVKGDDQGVEQIQKQLNKIIDTVKVYPITPENRVARELALVKIKLTKGDKSDLFQLINIYNAEIVDTSLGGIVVEITGSSEKIDGFINLLPQNLIVGIARSGIVAMHKLSYLPPEE